MKKSKQIYVNAKQEEFLLARQPDKSLVGGRGIGKSTIMGLENYLRFKHLPGAKFFFAAPTYNSILTKTMPAVEKIWKKLGLKEHLSVDDPGHYVVGRRPLKQWDKPISPPKKYDNVISFYNGFAIEFLSMDRPDLSRGGSYDGGSADEAALMKENQVDTVLRPSIRDNISYFNHWLHGQFSVYTSMPWKQSGNWVLAYEKLMTQFPDDYYYMEATALDNIEVLGEKYIERLRRKLHYLEFQIEVMNMRIKKLPDGFYHAFDDEKHCYQPKYKYGLNERGITSDGTKDINTNEPLDISMDFGGWINLMTIFQKKGRVEQLVDSLFVKDGKSVLDLVDDFCVKHKAHKNKFLRVWGEPRGHDKHALGDNIYTTVSKRFYKNGWKCEVKARAGRTSNHEDRYNHINAILKEDDMRLPILRINEENCKPVIIALQNTQVKPDGKKDKSAEKDRSFPQEHAPHFTDTIDYYFTDKYRSGSFRRKSGAFKAIIR